MFQKKALNIIVFLLVLTGFCLTYYNEVLFKLPVGVHYWAQSDRYSLAVNFYDRGMNFFKPATNNLESINGIVGVEFPIQAYIAAAIAHLFGRDSISICFRLLDIAIACTGLIFLFLTCLRATKDFIFSMVAPLFVFCAPIYIDYSGNYLPDPAAVSIMFIGFYYLFDFIERANFRALYISIAIMTLSALIKTSLAAFLFGSIGYAFILLLQSNGKYPVKRYLQLIITSTLSVGALAFYYFYNKYLNDKYHSMLFLAHAEPFRSWNEFSTYINTYFKTFMEEYMLQAQYLFLFAVCIPGVALLYRDKPVGRRHFSIIIIYFLASLSLFVVMGHQVSVHDYYFVSLFYPFIAYALLASVMFIYRYSNGALARRSLRTALVASLTIMFFFADHHMYLRTRPVYPPITDGSELWLQGGRHTMDSLHIPKTEKIFVAYDYPPNTSLVYLDRHGYSYCVDNWRTDTAISVIEERMRDRNTDIMVIKEQLVKNFYDNYPGLLRHFTVISRSGEIAVLRLNKN